MSTYFRSISRFAGVCLSVTTLKEIVLFLNSPCFRVIIANGPGRSSTQVIDVSGSKLNSGSFAITKDCSSHSPNSVTCSEESHKVPEKVGGIMYNIKGCSG